MAGQQAPAKTPTGRGAWNAAVRYNTVLILVVLLVAASFVSPDFMTAPNMSNVARQIVSVGIMSMGMLLVVLTGGIDLSVGSVAALASVTTALLIPDYGLATAISCGLLTGVVCGAICGTLVSQYRLQLLRRHAGDDDGGARHGADRLERRAGDDRRRRAIAARFRPRLPVGSSRSRPC